MYRNQIWRFGTYMFVHVGVLHIVMNIIVQIFLGTALEVVHGWWKVAIIYFSGVIAGSIGTSVIDPNAILAGASGGVYSLIAAHIATIILNWNEMTCACLQLFIYLIYCGWDTAVAFILPDQKIGYAAHFFGAIAGLLVGIGILRNLEVHPFERKLWWAAVIIYISLMITGISFHIFYPSYFQSN
jgi:rhomboid-related protein 1/2/3